MSLRPGTGVQSKSDVASPQQAHIKWQMLDRDVSVGDHIMIIVIAMADLIEVSVCYIRYWSLYL